MKSEEKLKIGNRISLVTIASNIVLSVVKILIGIIGKSSALIADGIHSISDVLSTIVAIIGLNMSKKPADKEHPYGHEKIEPIMSKLLASILLITALIIGYKGFVKITEGNFKVPGTITIYAAILSIVVKEWMYRYTVKGAKKIHSSVLLADAWHHRSDALSSGGALIGIVAARFGYPIFDSIASIVICIFIVKVAVDIYLHSVKQLIDHCADPEIIENIRNEILNVNGVIRIDDLKTRIYADTLYVDVEIAVNKQLSVSKAHEIAEQVHINIEKIQYNVKHCMVHVNPFEE